MKQENCTHYLDYNDICWPLISSTILITRDNDQEYIISEDLSFATMPQLKADGQHVMESIS